MSDNLKAVAERMRKHYACIPSSDTYSESPYWFRNGWNEHAINDDMDVLGRAYLADLAERERQAVEDALPVTEKWLREIGEDDQDSNEGVNFYLPGTPPRFVWISFSDRSAMIEERDGNFYAGSVYLGKYETRVQVSKLLEALGVEPKKGCK